jgi:hypothetical protein
MHAKLFVGLGVEIRFRLQSSTQLNGSLASLALSKGSLARNPGIIQTRAINEHQVS